MSNLISLVFPAISFCLTLIAWTAIVDEIDISDFPLKMGLSEDGDDAVETQFEELCLDLNMDKKAKDEALGNYQRMLENYTLEACVHELLKLVLWFATSYFF